MDVKEFCDFNSMAFRRLFDKAGVKYDRFIRTTEERHGRTVREVWERLDRMGCLKESQYSGYYSIADEAFVPEKDLVRTDSGFVSLTGQAVDMVTENNVMFRPKKEAFDLLREYIQSGRLDLQTSQVNEIEEFTKQGLDSFSVSRPISRVSWGIKPPSRDDQTVYVWFDALLNYLTISNELTSQNPLAVSTTHVIGKDITKFHCYLYPLMLISSGLFPSRMSILTHQHFLKDSTKMSKSLGNVIDPDPLLDRFGSNALRYYLLSQGPQYRDSSIDPHAIGKIYYNTLADLFVNLIMRITNRKLHDVNDFNRLSSGYLTERDSFREMFKHIEQSVKAMDFIATAHKVHKALMELNRVVHESGFWLEKGNDKKEILPFAIETLRVISLYLYPLVPDFVEDFHDVIGFKGKEIRIEDCSYGKVDSEGRLYRFDHEKSKRLFIRKVL